MIIGTSAFVSKAAAIRYYRVLRLQRQGRPSQAQTTPFSNIEFSPSSNADAARIAARKA